MSMACKECGAYHDESLQSCPHCHFDPSVNPVREEATQWCLQNGLKTVDDCKRYLKRARPRKWDQTYMQQISKEMLAKHRSGAIQLPEFAYRYHLDRSLEDDDEGEMFL